jgi:hypothetical protein
MQIDFLDTNVQLGIIILIVLIIAGYMYFNKKPEQPTLAPTIGPSKAPYTRPPTQAPPTYSPTNSPTDVPTDDTPPTDAPTDSPIQSPTDAPTDEGAYIKWADPAGSAIFTKDGKLNISTLMGLNNVNIKKQINANYQIRVKDGKLHLCIRSEKNGIASFNSIRAESDLEASINIQRSVGYIGDLPPSSQYSIGENIPSYLIQYVDGETGVEVLAIGDLQKPVRYLISLYNFVYIFTVGIATVSLEDSSILTRNGIEIRYPWHSTTNESRTEGICVKWPGNDDSGLGFLSYFGKTKPGKETFTFVKYDIQEFNSTPRLQFLKIGNKAGFDQLGKNYENTTGWAYDSNGGSRDKVDVEWIAWGTYLYLSY